MSPKHLFPRVTIHTEYYYRSFLTKTFTVGYLFSVAITLIVIILPFMTTYSTYGKYPSLVDIYPKIRSGAECLV